jgi:hypothetical protein
VKCKKDRNKEKHEQNQENYKTPLTRGRQNVFGKTPKVLEKDE